MANFDFKLVKQQNETEHEKPLNLQLRELDIDRIKSDIKFMEEFIQKVSDLMSDYDFKNLSDDELQVMHSRMQWCCIELIRLVGRYNGRLVNVLESAQDQ